MTPLTKLKHKLAELFQLDQADLDFGIYRIMNSRRREINDFIDHKLLPQVEQAFGQYKSADRVVIKEKLDQAVSQVESLGMNPAEQAVRFVVIDRRITQGTRSGNSRKSCELLWTVVGTCAMQGRSAFEFIRTALRAYFRDEPALSLVPALG